MVIKLGMSLYFKLHTIFYILIIHKTLFQINVVDSVKNWAEIRIVIFFLLRYKFIVEKVYLEVSLLTFISNFLFNK